MFYTLIFAHPLTHSHSTEDAGTEATREVDGPLGKGLVQSQ